MHAFLMKSYCFPKSILTKRLQILLLFHCLCLWVSCLPVLGQELNCKVTINAQQVQTLERQVFQEMENSFTQFLNNRRWTQDNFTPNERIQCNLLITMREAAGIGTFKANVQVQILRPVYGTTYNTQLFNFLDQYWEFDYAIGQQMDFNDNQFINNLTAMLGYYAYLIIGLDYDSFSKMGGTPFFEKALIITNFSGQARASGWTAFENNKNNNRYWMMENIMNSQLAPIRESNYIYHRQVLDQFTESPEKSRDLIIKILKDLSKVIILRPGAVFLNTFFDTKGVEMVNLLKEGTPEQKSEAAQLLSTLDPPKTEQYMKLVNP
jgi:hypothetical protein